MTSSTALVVALFVSVLAAIGCGGSTGAMQRGDGLDASMLPSEQRADYALFAQRCSKCHSLSRPLESGIDDDDFWAAYVAKMRRMPGSGISPDDTVGILRFLHYFGQTERERNAHPAPSAAPRPIAEAPMTAKRTSQ